MRMKIFQIMAMVLFRQMINLEIRMQYQIALKKEDSNDDSNTQNGSSV